MRNAAQSALCYVYEFSIALSYLGARQYAELWIDDALREQPRCTTG
jgi:hypothetical protein